MFKTNPSNLACRKAKEKAFRFAGLAATLLIAGSLIIILGTIVWKSLPALSLRMVTKTPTSGYYLGGEGGILNAIVGSILLGLGATVLAAFFSLPIALWLNVYKPKPATQAGMSRFFLDVLWGVPSIVYGTIGFLVMTAVGLRASLLAGIVVVALLEFPIMTRAMDEVVRMIPRELIEAASSLGATRLEIAMKVVARQCAPGLLMGMLIAFGRGIGDAASVLFTTGFSDRIPGSLLDPAATLPLAVFFQISSPFPEVQQRAYASAAVLTIIVLVVSLVGRAISRKYRKTSIL